MIDDPSYLERLFFAIGGGAVVRWFMRHEQGDIAVCTTRIVRSGRGLPWNEQIAIHPLENGKINMVPVRADETEQG